MRNFALSAGIGLAMLAAVPAFGQIVTPILTAPPCSGRHCPAHLGSAVSRPAIAHPAQRLPCPSGTVYMPQKGTCRVLPAAP